LEAHDRITDIIEPAGLPTKTRLVLANAVYFKGAWKHPFETSATADEDFSTPSAMVKALPVVHRPRGDVTKDAMRPWALTLGGLALAAMAVALFLRSRPLTLERVNEELGPDEDLVFVFATGPDNPQLACSQMGPAEDTIAQTATAVAVGWLDRRCENDHIQLRLSAQGRRRSAHWSRSGDSPLRPRTPEDEREWTNWFVTAARFERIGAPEIQPTDEGSARRVVVRGRWVPNDEGLLLRRAGWSEIRAPAERDEDFVLRMGRWHMVPKLLGRD
jgi:hypothetical protein